MVGVRTPVVVGSLVEFLTKHLDLGAWSSQLRCDFIGIGDDLFLSSTFGVSTLGKPLLHVL